MPKKRKKQASKKARPIRRAEPRDEIRIDPPYNVNDPDAPTPAIMQHYLEYVFPVGTFEALLPPYGYADVRINPDGERVFCYDVRMRSPQVVERGVVRQHLEQAVAQIPESLNAHVRWRVELCVVIVVDQQIAAQIRVAYLHRVH